MKIWHVLLSLILIFKLFGVIVTAHVCDNQAKNFVMESLSFIKDRDYESLSKNIHPGEGVIFAPFTTVVDRLDIWFSAEDVGRFGADETLHRWSAVPHADDVYIEMPVEEYFSRFVYDVDYLNIGTMSFNKPQRTDNSVENALDVFPGAMYYEFHYEGTEEYGWLDWSSLKIVFEAYEDGYKIVAIVHSSYVL